MPGIQADAYAGRAAGGRMTVLLVLVAVVVAFIAGIVTLLILLHFLDDGS